MTDDTKNLAEEDFELVLDEEAGTAPDIREKIKKFKERLEKCGTERKEYLEGWQRAKADLINYKNEEGRRAEDMARFLIAGLVQDVLPVLDSFDLALGHGLPAEVEKGVLLIRSQFKDILKKRGLVELEVRSNDEFSPEKHEALGEIASDVAVGKIAEVVQRGYLFRDRILRPARVRISKGRSF